MSDVPVPPQPAGQKLTMCIEIPTKDGKFWTKLTYEPGSPLASWARLCNHLAMLIPYPGMIVTIEFEEPREEDLS